MMTGKFDEFWFKKYDACVPWTPKYPVGLTQVPKLMALTPFVSICHAECSMFGRVKSGTINASQLFFEGSHVFSIFLFVFNLRIHACNKNKITTFYRWQWKYLTALLSKFVPYSDHNFKDKCGIKHKIIKKTNPVNTLRPRDSFCFLLVSSHFFYPNFKRPIPLQESILKQQVQIPLSIPKHSTKSSCPMYEPLPSPRQSHSRNPRTLPGPRPVVGQRPTLAPAEISCSTTAAWPFWAAQCSAVQPGRQGCDAGKAGLLQLPSRNKAIVMGCFSGLLGKYFWIGHKYQIRQADTFCMFYCEAWQKQEEQSSHNMFLLYRVV